MSRNRRLAAWHEAGHAAAWRALNGQVREVSIDNGGGGVCTPRYSVWRGPSRGSRSAQLRMAIAGPLVERQSQSWWHRQSLEQVLAWGAEHPESDGATVAQLLHGDSLSKWASRTKRLLWGYGHEIDDLAQALLDYGHLKGRTVRSILDGHGNQQ